jgi:hypothetical protein
MTLLSNIFLAPSHPQWRVGSCSSVLKQTLLSHVEVILKTKIVFMEMNVTLKEEIREL